MDGRISQQNLRVVSLKLLDLTQFAWPNLSIYFNFLCAVPRDDVIESTRFLMRPPVNHSIMGIPTKVVGTCFCGENMDAASNLSICVNFSLLIVMTYNDIKWVKYLDVISLFVSKHSTFNSPNSQYLKIFWFNLTDFMCFETQEFRKTQEFTILRFVKRRNLRNAGICFGEQELFSIPLSPWPFSSFRKLIKKPMTTDTTIYCTIRLF